MSRRYPEWEVEGKDWPNRTSSRFVSTDGYYWHMQEMAPDTKPEATGPKGVGPKGVGKTPVCLLLHGTGASTHSWRDVMPLLAKHYRVIAIDLPGHGFTRPTFKRQVTLPAMAGSISTLLAHIDITPDIIVGHSAGAAIGAQILLDKGWDIPLIGFTPALMPFPGLAAKIFPSLARILFTNPFVAIIFARLASGPGEAEKFLRRATGSKIDTVGVDYYQRLFSRSGHCDGAIRMMANWDLEKLRDRLSEIRAPVLLAYAENDSAIPKTSVLAAANCIPDCVTQGIAALGHLAHEEDAEQAARIIAEFAQAHAKS